MSLDVVYLSPGGSQVGSFEKCQPSLIESQTFFTGVKNQSRPIGLPAQLYPFISVRGSNTSFASLPGVFQPELHWGHWTLSTSLQVAYELALLNIVSPPL